MQKMDQNVKKVSDQKKKINQIKRKKRILLFSRIGIQGIAFLLAPALFSQAFSGVKGAASAMGSGEMLALTEFTARLLVLCGMTILAGRIFCGWLCVFGAVNDWIFQISALVQKKTGKKLPKLPRSWIPYLQKIKYVVLLCLLVLCFLGHGKWIAKHSPWTVFSLITVRNFKLAGYGVAICLCILLCVGMAVHERFFCQFFCPMGAIFSLLPELPFTALHRKQEDCIPNCQACKNQCPVQLKLGENTLQEGECIRCGRCMLTCPRGNIRVNSLR